MGLEFYALGVGDAFSAFNYASSLAVGCDGSWILVDCPHPIRRMLREAAPLDLRDIDAVLLTHLHADHASGLESYGYFSHFALGRRAQVFTHPQVGARLWEHLAPGMDVQVSSDGARTARQLDDWFDVRDLSVEDAVEVGPFIVEARFTRHPIPTTALRIHADGSVLSYSADTSWDPDLLAWLAEGDLIIHETSHGIHTPYAALAALPPSVRERMRLIHYPDEFDTEAAVIEPLAEGHHYEV